MSEKVALLTGWHVSLWVYWIWIPSVLEEIVQPWTSDQTGAGQKFN